MIRIKGISRQKRKKRERKKLEKIKDEVHKIKNELSSSTQH